MRVDLDHSATRHIQRAIASLASFGWTAEQIPAKGTLQGNRQLVVLKTPHRRLQLRLSIYKVGKTGRNRPDERRVEITTTYHAGIERLADYADVVLGYDPENDTYVGLDPRRLEYGGPTHNASTFVDRGSLAAASTDRILVQPYPAPILGGTEFQAYFRPERLSEYLFAFDAIHANLYLGDGPYSGRHSARGGTDRLEVADDAAYGELLVLRDSTTPRRRPRPARSVVEAYERGDYEVLRRARLTPEEYEALRRECAENGVLGEQRALEFERKRLREAGKPDLAERIEWISRLSVGEGFDIKSFNVDGTRRLIEVKATVGSRRSFEMTSNEWDIAAAKREAYYVYHVRRVRTDRPEIEVIQNPAQLEAAGRIERTPTGWYVVLK